MCPAVDADVAGLCVEQCRHDMDCWGERKCCSNGCGHVCLEPLAVVCPVIPEGEAGACIEFCGADTACPDGQMCCSNGCGHVCMTPIPGE